jgi:hypothetical protein
MESTKKWNEYIQKFKECANSVQTELDLKGSSSEIDKAIELAQTFFDFTDERLVLVFGEWQDETDLYMKPAGGHY